MSQLYCRTLHPSSNPWALWYAMGETRLDQPATGGRGAATVHTRSAPEGAIILLHHSLITLSRSNPARLVDLEIDPQISGS